MTIQYDIRAAAFGSLASLVERNCLLRTSALAAWAAVGVDVRPYTHRVAPDVHVRGYGLCGISPEAVADRGALPRWTAEGGRPHGVAACQSLWIGPPSCPTRLTIYCIAHSGG